MQTYAETVELLSDYGWSWCRPCLATMPAMKQYIDQYEIAPSGEIFSVGETDDLRTLIEVSKGR